MSNKVNFNNESLINDKQILQELIKRTDIIDSKLNTIISILNSDIKKNTDKMSSHIDFVDTVYSNVKLPLNYICDKIRYLQNNYSNNNFIEKSDKINDNDS
jgi:hypothetical protein